MEIDENIDAEWRDVLANRPEVAARWALVRIFGDERQYHYDAEFHARVHLAERMLVQIPAVRTTDDE